MKADHLFTTGILLFALSFMPGKAIHGAVAGNALTTAVFAVGVLPGEKSNSSSMFSQSLFQSEAAAPSASDPFRNANRGPDKNPPFVVQSASSATPWSGAVQQAVHHGGATPTSNNRIIRRLPSSAANAVFGNGAPVRGATQFNSAQPNSTPPNHTAQRRHSDGLLVQARLRMAEGDLRTATNILNEAKGLGVRYDKAEDSPAKIEKVLNRRRELDQVAQQLQQSRGDTSGIRHRQAQLLLEEAEALLKWRQFDAAEALTQNAQKLSTKFHQFEKNPRELFTRIANARNGSGVRLAVFNQTVPPWQRQNPLAPRQDPAVTQVQGAQPKRAFQLPPPKGASDKDTTTGMRLFLAGEKALRNQQPDEARQLYLQAERLMHELDAATQDRLRGRLNILNRGQLLTESQRRHDLLRRKASAELANAQRAARTLQEKNPRGSLRVLQLGREQVVKAGLDPASERQLLLRVDHDIRAMEQYLERNKPRLSLEDRNEAVRKGIDRDRAYKIQVQQELAQLVNKFNKLMDEQRWHEAEVLAKRAEDIAPDEPVVKQLKWMNRFRRNLYVGGEISDSKARNFLRAMDDVDRSGIPYDTSNPRSFPEKWDELKKRRHAKRMDRRRTAKEIEIEQKLKTPVSLRFDKAPLHEVMDFLARMADVNLHLDPLGLSAEGVSVDAPVTINLTQGDISLKSALHIILAPFNLSYVIKDEVLKITSSYLRDSEVYTVTYSVADLVIPIPNFTPTVGMGLEGAYRNAFRQANSFGMGGHSPVVAMASAGGGTTNVALGNSVLANLAQAGGVPGLGAPQSLSGGPGGLGGGSRPDFDPLIELVVTTIQPGTWEEVGGPGRVARFVNNLTLVISQTQDVHDQIEDLLGQLRRLQDLQVTIEVRFISLNDNFFERIGIDFDFDIDDDTDAPFAVFGQPTGQNPTVGVEPSQDFPRNFQDRDHGPSTTVGLSMPGVFSADLDIPVQQGSFALAIPQFGNFAPGSGATIGFAILSDLEAFFFIEASQGDRRSNVLQAPKVTLFNGQEAIINDTTQTPFVISIIPVVGDFAAAQQPVIAVLNEGTFLNVQAVVSHDRRFVRLTVVPFFSSIGEVNTFTFSGASSTVDEANNNLVSSQQGTTVQLPSFSFLTVTTTVSVPDGGTVLLGGIKRLSEGRSEFGVPILNKVPYLNRLFKNVGIGRETQSLMLMVTPRIIIQEEEESLLQ